MFIGHFALAFAAKRAVPATSLGTLFAAAQAADLIWPNLVLLGIESVRVVPGATAVTPLEFVHYPYSHSLLALCLWAIVLGGAYYFVRSGGAGALAGALAIALLTLSHWFLDALAHRPDMPLAIDGAARAGLGLWNSVAATIAIEGLMFAAGVALYARTRAPTRGLWLLVAFLTIVYIANLTGPPPPSAAAVAWAAQSMWLLVAWAWWADRRRARM